MNNNNSVLSWSDDKEYLDIISDLITNPKVLKMRDFVHHHYSNRLDHSLAVSYRSYLIARNLNLDFRSVARAGLLHDFFLLNREEVMELKIGSHSSAHPKLALENAREITTINEIEEDIILKHMFGATITPPRYRESYLVSIVDKYVAIEDVFNPLSKLVKYKMVMAMMMTTMIFNK